MNVLNPMEDTNTIVLIKMAATVALAIKTT